MLRKINVGQKGLHNPEITFEHAYENFNAKNLEICTRSKINIKLKRIRRKKFMSAEMVIDESLLHQHIVKQKNLAEIYRIIKEMQPRNTRLHVIGSRFGVLYKQKIYLQKIKMKLIYCVGF